MQGEGRNKRAHTRAGGGGAPGRGLVPLPAWELQTRLCGHHGSHSLRVAPGPQVSPWICGSCLGSAAGFGPRLPLPPVPLFEFPTSCPRNAPSPQHAHFPFRIDTALSSCPEPHGRAGGRAGAPAGRSELRSRGRNSETVPWRGKPCPVRPCPEVGAGGEQEHPHALTWAGGRACSRSWSCNPGRALHTVLPIPLPTAHGSGRGLRGPQGCELPGQWRGTRVGRGGPAQEDREPVEWDVRLGPCRGQRSGRPRVRAPPARASLPRWAAPPGPRTGEPGLRTPVE